MLMPQNWTMSFSASVLLAAVATLGYLFGRRRQDSGALSRDNMRHEIMRSLAVAQELESIAYRLRKSMASHVPAIARLNNRLHRWERSGDISRQELCNQADELLKPAMRLSTEISHAYADLLQQMTQLSAFAELSTDPLTGVSNRRAFDDSLVKSLTEHEGSETPLSIAMLDLDQFKKINDEQGQLVGDRVLQDLTQLLKICLREDDILARYGGEEFVVIMPQTPLRTACNLAQRMRARIEGKLATTISVGVAANTASESATSLLSRADAALNMAKNEGRNCVCLHEGPTDRIVTIRTPSTSPADEQRSDDDPQFEAASSEPQDAESALHGHGV
jgi:diguanylate cyclase